MIKNKILMLKQSVELRQLDAVAMRDRTLGEIETSISHLKAVPPIVPVR